MSELSKNLSLLDPETIEVVSQPQTGERSLEELMANGIESPIGIESSIIVAGGCSCSSCFCIYTCYGGGTCAGGCGCGGCGGS